MVDATITYVARLYTEEFHLLARVDITSLGDLAGEKVAVGAEGSGTAITAAKLFSLLGIAIVPVKDPPSVALAMLESNQIAAVALVAGKPAPLLGVLDGSDGLHLLAIPMTDKLAAVNTRRIMALTQSRCISALAFDQAGSQHIELGAAVHLAFDQFEFRDLSLCLAVRPGLDDGGGYSASIIGYAAGE